MLIYSICAILYTLGVLLQMGFVFMASSDLADPPSMLSTLAWALFWPCFAIIITIMLLVDGRRDASWMK